VIDETALRGYLARILGWSAGQATAVENALLAIRLSVTHYTALVLLGDMDLVPVARALHLRVLGAERPFIVADPRRGDVPPSVRSPASRGTGLGAFEAARGGTLCARLARLPADYSFAIGRAREPGADVRIVIVGDSRYDRHPFLANPPPIRIPSLAQRTEELPRIIDEYAAEAIAALGVGPGSFTDADREWVLEYAAESLPIVEAATLRLTALRASRTTDEAAAAVGLRGAALRKWRIQRRRRRGGGVRPGGIRQIMKQVARPGV